MKKKTFISIFLIVILTAILIAGCTSPSPTPSPTPTPTQTAAPSPSPTQTAAPTPTQTASPKPTTPASSPSPTASPSPTPAPKPDIPSPPEKQVMVGSTPSSSTLYAALVSIGNIMNKYIPGINATVIESGANVDNTNRMLSGQIHMGLDGPQTLYSLAQGLDPWKDKPSVGQVVQLFLFSNHAIEFIVREDSGVNTLYDLEGKGFNPGSPGTTTRQGALAIFDVLGIKPNIVEGSISDAVAAIKDKRIVGYTKSQTGRYLDASTLEMTTYGKIKMLGLSDADIEKLSKDPRTSWIPLAFYPDGWYKELPEIKAHTTVSSPAGVGIRRDVSDDLAYATVKAVHLYPELLLQAWPAFEGFDLPKETIAAVSRFENVYLHPGAAKYFRELGIDVPAKILPPAK